MDELKRRALEQLLRGEKLSPDDFTRPGEMIPKDAGLMDFLRYNAAHFNPNDPEVAMSMGMGSGGIKQIKFPKIAALAGKWSRPDALIKRLDSPHAEDVINQQINNLYKGAGLYNRAPIDINSLKDRGVQGAVISADKFPDLKPVTFSMESPKSSRLISNNPEHEGFHLLMREIKNKFGPSSYENVLNQILPENFTNIEPMLTKFLNEIGYDKLINGASKGDIIKQYILKEEQINMIRGLLTNENYRQNFKKINSLTDDEMNNYMVGLKKSWKDIAVKASNIEGVEKGMKNSTLPPDQSIRQVASQDISEKTQPAAEAPSQKDIESAEIKSGLRIPLGADKDYTPLNITRPELSRVPSSEPIPMGPKNVPAPVPSENFLLPEDSVPKAAGFAHGGEVNSALVEYLKKLRGY